MFDDLKREMDNRELETAYLGPVKQTASHSQEMDNRELALETGPSEASHSDSSIRGTTTQVQSSRFQIAEPESKFGLREQAHEKQPTDNERRIKRKRGRKAKGVPSGRGPPSI